MSYAINSDAPPAGLALSSGAQGTGSRVGLAAFGARRADADERTRTSTDYLHTDLNRIRAVSLGPAASDASKLRGFVDGWDAVDGMDVVTMLSRPAAEALRLWYARCIV